MCRSIRFFALPPPPPPPHTHITPDASSLRCGSEDSKYMLCLPAFPPNPCSLRSCYTCTHSPPPLIPPTHPHLCWVCIEHASILLTMLLILSPRVTLPGHDNTHAAWHSTSQRITAHHSTSQPSHQGHSGCTVGLKAFDQAGHSSYPESSQVPISIVSTRALCSRSCKA